MVQISLLFSFTVSLAWIVSVSPLLATDWIMSDVFFSSFPCPHKKLVCEVIGKACRHLEPFFINGEVVTSDIRVTTADLPAVPYIHLRGQVSR